MARTFIKSSKPNSNMVDTTTKNGEKNAKFDKQSNKKNQFSKTPVKIPSLQSIKKKKKIGEIKQKIDKYGGKRVTLDKNEKGKMGFFNKQSRGEKGSSLGFDDKNGEKRVRMDKNEEGKMGIFNKNSRGENGSSLGFDEKNEKSRIPIKVSSFEKMKMKKSEENGVGLLEKRKRTKKMSIKIDRYDVSNKRLDDGVVLDDITNKQKKKKVEEGKENSEVAELSVNAQFRAIKPSPSIVTFVQENFLGRRREIELRRAGYNTELPAPLDNLPFTTSSERERVEESVFRNKLEFFAAAKVSSSFPLPDLPEIAFAGRSNVGKSSLLNALTRQWGVVRTSDKPGHTQSINFFNLGTKLTMVDLPGYGFAYAKDEVKEAWEDLVKQYVSTRVGLKRVCLLIDTKWGMKPRDMELIHLMERSQTKYQVVLTKTDVVFPIDVARRAMQIEERLKEHKSIVQPVMMVSSKSGAGIRCLRTVLGKMGRFLKP